MSGPHSIRARPTDYGISTKLIISFLRDRPPVEAVDLLTQLLEKDARFDGIGLDSAEIGYPPALFVDLYDLARANGLHIVAHAGEEGPPQYVTDALDLLHVERIDHGNRSLEDEALIARLVAERIPLTVCPLSNVRLRVVDDLEWHPIRRMLAHGLNVSVHSDDPAYFGGYIDDNIDAIIERCGVTSDELARLARNSIDSSFLDAEGKARLRLEVDVWSAAQSPSR
ncbi:adenosine deaminase family protein [Agromyces ramosus]|uniref:adenosine deaminase family protein n=1 Tax=Agromyces ramosus TaxID=33879 RepID=UPI003BF78C17